MVNRKMKAAGEWIEDHIRQMCGRLNHDTRLFMTITMLILFTALSLYFTLSSIYRFGMGSGRRIRIEHIEEMKLELQKKQLELDSLKHINQFQYEHKRRSY